MSKFTDGAKAFAKWVGFDGLLHFAVSALLVVILGVVMPAWIAVIVVIAIGGLKELVWDLWLHKGTPEGKDMMCNIAGTTIGAICLVLLSL